MIRWFFHAGCAIVLAASVLFATQGEASRPTPDPRDQLFRFMTGLGFTLGGSQEILSGETIYRFERDGCSRPVTVLYLPIIHRISDISHEIAGRQEAVFVHDGSLVSDLDAVTLIPRWLWRRTLVNFQVAPENPWISIALAVQDPGRCLPATIDWTELRTS